MAFGYKDGQYKGVLLGENVVQDTPVEAEKVKMLLQKAVGNLPQCNENDCPPSNPNCLSPLCPSRQFYCTAFQMCMDRREYNQYKEKCNM